MRVGSGLEDLHCGFRLWQHGGLRRICLGLHLQEVGRDGLQITMLRTGKNATIKAS